MSAQPLVSVLIPCHNAVRWVGACLESVLAQSWPSLEIIVVDDGSTDASAACVSLFEPRGVRLIRTPNRGAAAARNRAFAESRGAFIQFLDADDLLAPAKIELQMRRLLGSEGIAIASGEWARFYDDPIAARFTTEPTWADHDPVAFLRLLYAENRMMHPAAWLLPRSIPDACGPWNEELTLDDDGEFFARAVLASERVLFVEGARSYYRSGLHGSLSHRQTPRAWQSQYRAIELSTAALLARDGTEETRRACADRWQRFIFSAYPDAPRERQLAEGHVRALGGSTLRPDGGPLLKWVEGAIGWKAARRLRRILYDAGYQKLGHVRRARALRRHRQEKQ
jgi:glycosyltransferase involved in cell wall biosynthesis